MKDGNNINFIAPIKMTLKVCKIFLNALNIPKQEWRYHINLVLSKSKEYVEEMFKSYEDIVISEDWIKECKEKERRKRSCSY